MPEYKIVARLMVEDYLELEELTNNNRGIPNTALAKKYEIDGAAAGELWRGVRMGMLQKSDEKKYGLAAKIMHEDNIVNSIEDITNAQLGEKYHIDGGAAKNILHGLQAAKLKINKNITQADTNIPDGITSDLIKKAVDDFNDGTVEHRFIESTKYDVIIDGNRYPPKAIVGLASKYILGQPLSPAQFSAGIGKKCFKILQDNGFKIVIKSKDNIYPDDLSEKDVHYEGAVKQTIVNRYERDTRARDKCIEYYGLKCQVCSFDFEEIYGELGAGFIHVHHLTKISDIGKEYKLDPIKDLRPVCPNCHAMLHKTKIPMSIDKLKSKLI